ncbi:MAG: hypothetical protein Fur0022_00350 [Anaerolineales bacterium]
MENKTKKSQSISKKRADRRSERRRQRIRTGITIGVVALVVLAAVVALFINNAEQPIEGVVAYPGLEQGHVETPVTYEQSPPVGGPHNPAWQNCGVYPTPIANENGVHSLEHGAVWITYQPDLPAADVQALQTLARQGSFRLLTPYPDLPSPIVISAWGYQLQLEQADDPRLASFIENYEQSPRAPEPGAPCTGGLGQPG